MRYLLALPLLMACQPVQVYPPDNFGKVARHLPAPKPSQRHIDAAMGIYRINRPADCMWPVYDPDLDKRGLTLLKGYEPKVVYIGPPAFGSWALLGSTLAHEIEVHCKQNLSFIVLMDLLGLPGTAEAEMEAYTYEMDGMQRFGLSISEVVDIGHTALTLYPKQK